ncbi:hypothetical protein ACS4RR_006285 [Rhizobium sp. Z1P35]
MKDAPTPSTELMTRLRGEARLAQSARRLATLARLEQACDDVVSGRALELARKHGWDGSRFRAHRRLVAASVDEYVRMMRYAEPKGGWTGPTKDTIAHDQELASYVNCRDAERATSKKPPRKGTGARRADDIVTEKLDFTDQAIVRAALESGRLAKRQFDTLASFFHKLLGVDLRSHDAFSFEDVARSIRAQISRDDREALASLVDRLHDDVRLMEMNLIIDKGKVRMYDGLRSVLVERSEMAVLIRLAGLNPDSLGSVG